MLKILLYGKEISFSLINDVIAEAKDNSPFSICRLAIKHE
jgi:hypothetical protein